MTAAALSVAGTAFANTTAIEVALTKPAGGILNSGNSVLEWDTSTYGASFANWEVSFDLTIAQTPANNSALFSTERKAGGGALGSIFQINANGTVQWSGETSSTTSWVNLGNSVSVTLSYDGSTLTAMNNESGDFVTVNASGAALTSGSSSLWTNGGRETFSGITVKNTSVVPEPSAFGLLAGMGALALVASRRRRR